MRVEILREYLPKCTLGDLHVYDDRNNLILPKKSLELPWQNNQNNISCIPEEEYDVIKMAPTEKRPYVYFHVLNVPNRKGILWHPANYTRQILGCLIPGESHVDLDNDGIMDITSSTKTLKILADLLPDKFKAIYRKK